MASFSSRGGPGLTLGVSKPDVTAPGVQILAGHTPLSADPDTGPQGELFQAIAGTSMSSPHVAGAAALLKDLHPDWTPGQIKSALMTTAQDARRRQGGRRDAAPVPSTSARVASTWRKRPARGSPSTRPARTTSPSRPTWSSRTTRACTSRRCREGQGAAHGPERPRPAQLVAPRRRGAPRPRDRRPRAASSCRPAATRRSTSRSTRAGFRSGRCVTPRSSSSRTRADARTSRSRSSARRRRSRSTSRATRRPSSGERRRSAPSP